MYLFHLVTYGLSKQYKNIQFYFCLYILRKKATIFIVASSRLEQLKQTLF